MRLSPSLIFFVFIPFLNGCLTDGPNKTGKVFLEENGAVLDRRLDSAIVTLAVDSFLVADTVLARPGDSYWLTGKTGNFTMVSRLGFVVDSVPVLSYLSDSQPVPDSAVNKLYLSTSIMTVFNKYLPSAVISRMSRSPKTDLLVKAFLFTTTDDSIKAIADHFISDFRDLPTFQSLFPSFSTTLDTAFKIDQRTVLDADTIVDFIPQKSNLPHLLQQLKQNLYARQWVLLEISLLDTADGDRIIRFSSSTSLVFGSTDSGASPDTVPLSTTLLPYPLNNHKIFNPLLNDQQNPTLLSGVSQGFHFFLDRQKFLSAVRRATGGTLSLEDSDSKFNNQYFIPYATVTVPLAIQKTDSREFNFGMRLSTEIDSIPSENISIESEITVPLGATKSTDITVYKQGTYIAADNIKLSYFKPYKNAGIFRLAILYEAFSKYQDTLEIAPGSTQEFIHYRRTSDFGIFRVQLVVEADTGKAIVRYHYNNPRSQDDYNAYLADSNVNAISLTCTRGVQALFSRTDTKNSLFHDFRIRPNLFPKLKTGQTAWFPVFQEFPIQIDPGSHLNLQFKIFYYQMY